MRLKKQKKANEYGDVVMVKMKADTREELKVIQNFLKGENKLYSISNATQYLINFWKENKRGN